MVNSLVAYNDADFSTAGTYVLFGKDSWSGEIDVVAEADVFLTADQPIFATSVGNLDGASTDQQDELMLLDGSGTAHLFYGDDLVERAMPHFSPP